ncbi:dTMP kinase [Populibacterium corticicola]|uniref:Thymidylate kinase n=1 Tax=Populibacterium corticicola TaxID=1812826 RepID=A0ABW5XJT3_9MICO
MTDSATFDAAITVPVHTSTNGIFVSFEGGDGCGKTTQSTLLGEWLAQALGTEVNLTREPGGTPLGREIRQLLLHGDDMGSRAEALLYAADRSHHIDTVVRPALDRGEVVVTDRYIDSSVAYQGGGRELTPTQVRGLSLWATEGLMPHLTVLLDISPEAGAARFTDAPDRLERSGDEFHRRTRQTYLDMAADEPARWIVVDAHGTIEDIAREVRTRATQCLSALFPQHAQALNSALEAEGSRP